MVPRHFTLFALAMLLVPFTTTAAFGAAAQTVVQPAGLDQEATPASDEAKTTYTWDELVELIPDLREMQVVYPKKKRRKKGQAVASAEDPPAQPMLCRYEARPSVASRIKRRKCYTLDEYVTQYIEAQQTYRDMLGGRIESGYIVSGTPLGDANIYALP